MASQYEYEREIVTKRQDSFLWLFSSEGSPRLHLGLFWTPYIKLLDIPHQPLAATSYSDLVTVQLVLVVLLVTIRESLLTVRGQAHTQ